MYIGQVYDINIKKSLKLLVPWVYAQYEVGLLVFKYGNIFFAGRTRLFQARSKLVGMPVCPHRLSKYFLKNLLHAHQDLITIGPGTGRSLNGCSFV